jgi:hypothetical protein
MTSSIDLATAGDGSYVFDAPLNSCHGIFVMRSDDFSGRTLADSCRCRVAMQHVGASHRLRNCHALLLIVAARPLVYQRCAAFSHFMHQFGWT